MTTITQLKKENERLMKMQGKLRQIQKDNEDRRKLLRENKTLARQIKHGKTIDLTKKVGNTIADIGRVSGREVFRAGKGAFKGLQRYGNFLAEQEAKSRRLNKTLKKTKRKIVKVRRKPVKRRRKR